MNSGPPKFSGPRFAPECPTAQSAPASHYIQWIRCSAVYKGLNRTTHPSSTEVYDIKVPNKPVRTLQQEFPSPKVRPKIEKQTNVVYKIVVKTARGVMSVKQEGVLKQGKMNIFGPMITQLTLKMDKS